MGLLPGVPEDEPVWPDVPGIWGDYEIEEVLEFQARPAGGSYVLVNVRSLRTGTVYERMLYDTASVFFPVCEWCKGIATDCEGLCLVDTYEDTRYRDGWYNYDDGLHWSDFVDGPIGD